MAYQLEGRLLEVCDCKVLCPCWIGEDPDNGSCDSAVAWHIDKGTVDGVDVSGRTIAGLAHAPGNMGKGGWRVVILVDDAATPEQAEALVNVWTGKRGGPLADYTHLFAEIVAIERVPITFTVEGGKGTLKIGGTVDAEMEPYRGPTGAITTLNESMFSTIPGSPAYVAKAATFRRAGSRYGMKDVNLTGHNAIQGYFRFEA